MTRPALLLAMLALLTLGAPVRAQQESPFSGPGASSAPVEITADLFEIDTTGRQAVFSGNVVVSQTGFTLWSERLIVTYGEGGRSDLQFLSSPGRARIAYGGQTASGDSAEFDVAGRVLRISGNVEVEGPVGNFAGPLLVIDFARGTTSFRGGGGGRVTGTFTPGG